MLKALGLSGRPAPAHMPYLDRWFKEYGFTLEIVTEACNRTIRAIQKPSFDYVNKILTDWKEKGVRCVGDIEKLDKKHIGLPEKGVREGGTYKGASRTVKAANRFHNFKEHDYDYDALMKQAIKQNREN